MHVHQRRAQTTKHKHEMLGFPLPAPPDHNEMPAGQSALLITMRSRGLRQQVRLRYWSGPLWRPARQRAGVRGR